MPLPLVLSAATRPVPRYAPGMPARFGAGPSPISQAAPAGLNCVPMTPDDLPAAAVFLAMQAAEEAGTRADKHGALQHFKHLKQLLATPRTLVPLLKNAQNKVVGLATLRPYPGQPAETTGDAEILNVYIDKAYRSRGVGRWLMAKLATEGKALGFIRACLWTISPRAYDFYVQKAGFTHRPEHDSTVVEIDVNQQTTEKPIFFLDKAL